MDDISQLLEADRRYLVHPLHYPDDHKQPLVVAEGRGAMLYDAEGREYIDGLSGLWNVNVGHGRAELAEAASAQMRRIAFASAYIGATNEPAIRLAEKIVGHAYPNTAAAYFTTAGAESNESAFKFARYYWKIKDKPEKTKIISRIHAYHGVTLAAMSATGMAAYRNMFGPLVPGFIQVAAPYPYRWAGNEEPGTGAADAVEQAILAEGPDTIAAVIAEPVMGAGGVIVPPPSYFPRLREICDRHDVLLIADEVITGFGRTGGCQSVRATVCRTTARSRFPDRHARPPTGSGDRAANSAGHIHWRAWSCRCRPSPPVPAPAPGSERQPAPCAAPRECAPDRRPAR